MNSYIAYNKSLIIMYNWCNIVYTPPPHRPISVEMETMSKSWCYFFHSIVSCSLFYYIIMILFKKQYDISKCLDTFDLFLSFDRNIHLGMRIVCSLLIIYFISNQCPPSVHCSCGVIFVVLLIRSIYVLSKIERLQLLLYTPPPSP